MVLLLELTLLCLCLLLIGVVVVVVVGREVEVIRGGGGKGNSGVTTTTTTAARDGRGERWNACLFPSEFLAFLPLLLLLSLFDDAFVVESVILTMFPSEAVFSPPGCGVGCEILITIIAIEPGASHRR